MSRRSKEDALETRNRILDAAEHVFFEKGVSRSSLADIAQHAGVTRGAIYWHFAHKGDLFDAMFDRVLLPLDILFSPPAEGPPADPLTRLRKILIWCLLGLARDPQLRRVFSILFLKCEYGADTEPLLLRNRTNIQDVLNRISNDLADAVARGQLPENLDTWRGALMLHMLVTGFLHDALMLPDTIDIEAHAEKLVDAGFDTLRLSLAMRNTPS